MVEHKEYLERICSIYFSDPERSSDIPKGTQLLTCGMPNDKLYYVLEGTFAGIVQEKNADGEMEDVELFQVGAGRFIGVHSFFREDSLTSVTVVALSDARLRWIDKTCQPVEEEKYGGLIQQFLRIMQDEMYNRHINLIHVAREREAYQKRLHTIENMAALGRFAAGLAHELNNSIGVFQSTAMRIDALLNDMIADYRPDLSFWFMQGKQRRSRLSSAEIRLLARDMMKRFDLDHEQAKNIVRIFGGGIDSLPANLNELITVWEAGRNCHDMQVAATHAAHVIQSIKQISSGGNTVRSKVNVIASLNEALLLLRTAQQGILQAEGQPEIIVDIKADTTLPDVYANKSELVQILINLIRNAVDAMREAEIAKPVLYITAQGMTKEVRISIINNGPAIPLDLQKTLFQPGITSKKGKSQSMGLGMGLYIVKRLVEGYGGRIALSSDDCETCFTIYLPLELSDAPSEIMPLVNF